MTTTAQWLAELDIEPITEAEQRQDELERLIAQRDEIWARDDPDDEPRGHAECAGRADLLERICGRIAELKKL